jgi:serine protease inhibitor
MKRASVQLLALSISITMVKAGKKETSQEVFAYKIYKAQLMESYNQNRNMVMSPSSTYRMLHAFCLATTGKAQRELKQLVACNTRDTIKIDKILQKVERNKIHVSNDFFLLSRF